MPEDARSRSVPTRASSRSATSTATAGRPRVAEPRQRQRDDPVAAIRRTRPHALRAPISRRRRAGRGRAGDFNADGRVRSRRLADLRRRHVQLLLRNATNTGFDGPTPVAVADAPTQCRRRRLRRRRRVRRRGHEQRGARSPSSTAGHDPATPIRSPGLRSSRSRTSTASSPDLASPPTRRRARGSVSCSNTTQPLPPQPPPPTPTADAHADAAAARAGRGPDRQRDPGLRHRAHQGTGQQPLRHPAGG